jgi:hypothetical protein
MGVPECANLEGRGPGSPKRGAFMSAAAHSLPRSAGARCVPWRALAATRCGAPQALPIRQDASARNPTNFLCCSSQSRNARDFRLATRVMGLICAKSASAS